MISRETLPVILLTSIVALVLSILPLPGWLPVIRPAFLVLAVLYWSTMAPFVAGMALGFFGGLALMAGLALSGYMHSYIAIGLLVAFLLLSIQSYLATYTLGEFQLSFWSFGPTELRILLAIGNLALFRWPIVLHGHYRLFDAGGAIGLAGMSTMLIFFTAKNTYRLYQEEKLP